MLAGIAGNADGPDDFTVKDKGNGAFDGTLAVEDALSVERGHVISP